jgi:hypothetical protein
MSVLVLIAALFSYLSGFNTPLLKERIGSQLENIEVCSSGGCQH